MLIPIFTPYPLAGIACWVQRLFYGLDDKGIVHREENQLDATEWFIALVMCSTCFGHLHANRQELETILVLLPHMVCNALVAGGRWSGAGQQAMRPG